MYFSNDQYLNELITDHLHIFAIPRGGEKSLGMHEITVINNQVGRMTRRFSRWDNSGLGTREMEERNQCAKSSEEAKASFGEDHDLCG